MPWQVPQGKSCRVQIPAEIPEWAMLNVWDCYLIASQSDWIAEYQLGRYKSLGICASGSTGGYSSNQRAPLGFFSESYHSLEKYDEIAKILIIGQLLLTLYSVISLPGLHLDGRAGVVCNWSCSSATPMHSTHWLSLLSVFLPPA